jgi:hypothetical protein
MRGEVEFVIRESVWVQNAAALFAAMDEAGVPRDGFYQSPEGEWYTVATRTSRAPMIRTRKAKDSKPVAEDTFRDENGNPFRGAPGSQQRLDEMRAMMVRIGEAKPDNPEDEVDFGIVVIID